MKKAGMMFLAASLCTGMMAGRLAAESIAAALGVEAKEEPAA